MNPETGAARPKISLTCHLLPAVLDEKSSLRCFMNFEGRIPGEIVQGNLNNAEGAITPKTLRYQGLDPARNNLERSGEISPDHRRSKSRYGSHLSGPTTDGVAGISCGASVVCMTDFSPTVTCAKFGKWLRSRIAVNN